MMVLVTGGGGFIGHAVFKALHDKGHEARVFTAENKNDVRDEGAVLRAVRGMDAVIHLAGVLGTHELFDTVQLAIDVNIKGTANVLNACKVADAQYVGITMPQVFPSIYTATKVAATRLATAFHQSHDLRVSHVRAFNAFGPGQAYGEGHPQKIIPTFAVCAARDEPIPIWGDGSQGVDLVHVDELARMLVCALNFVDDEVIDGGTGKMDTVLDVAFDVARILEVDPLIQFKPMRRGEVPTAIVAEGETWGPLAPAPKRIPLDETVLWYKEKYA